MPLAKRAYKIRQHAEPQGERKMRGREREEKKRSRKEKTTAD